MANLPLPLSSDPAPFKFAGETRLINLYPESVGRDKRNPVILKAIPGQISFADNVSDIHSRGGIEVDALGIAYSLHGSTLYQINPDGSSEALVGIIPGSKPVMMEVGPERFDTSEVTLSTIGGTTVEVRWVNHRLSAATPIQFSSTGQLPFGIEAGETYYVRDTGLETNTFHLSLNADHSGGAVVSDGNEDQSGVHSATREDGTYQVVIVSDLAAFVVEDDNIYFIDLEEAPNSATYIDGRWVFGHDSGRFSYSELRNARVVDPLSFGNAEARPDGLVRAFADGGELWLIGQKTIEIYTGSGDPDEPFVPLSGAFIPKGCASKDTVASFDNAVHFLGNDGVVYRAVQYDPVRISSHAVERDIERVTDKTTIAGYVDIAGGHTFYVLTCALWTWVFDAATKRWHERKSRNRPDWRAAPYIAAFGKRLVGDKESGNIYELTDEAHDEHGLHLRVEMILPDIPGRFFFHRLDLGVATGVGLGVAEGLPGYEPKVMLSWSNDGGHTYGSERIESIGRQGQHGRLVTFTGLGKSDFPGRRFKIACSEPTIKSFFLADLQADPWG